MSERATHLVGVRLQALGDARRARRGALDVEEHGLEAGRQAVYRPGHLTEWLSGPAEQTDHVEKADEDRGGERDPKAHPDDDHRLVGTHPISSR